MKRDYIYWYSDSANSTMPDILEPVVEDITPIPQVFIDAFKEDE